MDNPFLVLREDIAEIKSLLLDLKQPTPSPDPPDRCQLKDACEITGLSKAAIYKLTSEKKLPHAKFGSRLIFSRRLLSAWVESHTVTPALPADKINQRLAASARKKLRR